MVIFDSFLAGLNNKIYFLITVVVVPFNCLLTAVTCVCIQASLSASVKGKATPIRTRMMAYSMLRKILRECLASIKRPEVSVTLSLYNYMLLV